MSESLVNEKGRTEHLEASLMEVMELKKHEVSCCHGNGILQLPW